MNFSHALSAHRLVPTSFVLATCLLVAAGCRETSHPGGEPPVDGGGSFDLATRDPDTGIGPSPRSVAVFDEEKVVDFDLTFPAGEWEKLLATPVPTPTSPKIWVRCSFAFAGERFDAAACRRKGNAEDWKVEKKPQLIVRFNLMNPQGRFRGLRRLNLESFDGTDAPIRDRLAMWLMRESGVDAPRANHARVTKNGAYLGLYQNIEVIDKEFLEDHFGAESGGNLWEQGEELETNEEMPDRRALTALDELIYSEPLSGSHATFYAALEKTMDVHQVLREMAGETALGSTDNFSNGASNFYFYEHPTRGFLVLPWDLDQVLTFAPAESDPYAYWGDPQFGGDPNRLRQLMNMNAAWKTEFTDAVVAIRDGVLARMPARVDFVCAQIRDAVKADQNRNSGVAEFDADCAAVKKAVNARIAGLRKTLHR